MSRNPRVFFAVLVGSGASWGVTVSLGKIAVSTGHGPLGLIFWQFVIAALTLSAGLIGRRKWPALTPRRLRFAAIIAVLGTLFPNTVFYIAVGHLPAGVVSIVTSTIPLLSYILAVGLGSDHVQAKRILGLLLGFAGVVLVALPEGQLPGNLRVAYVAFALLAPVFYAIEANFVDRNGTEGLGPVEAMFLISVVGAIISAPLALFSGQWINPMAAFGAAEIALVLSSMLHAVAYAAYVWLAATAGAVFAAQSSYIVTASGVFWAMVLLGERFSGSVWAALILILFGLIFVQPRRAGVAGEGLSG